MDIYIIDPKQDLEHQPPWQLKVVEPYKHIFHGKIQVLASEPMFNGETKVSVFSFCNLVTLHL